VTHLWEAAETKARQRAHGQSAHGFRLNLESRGDFGLTIREWPAVFAAANAHRRGEVWWSVGLAVALVAGFLLGRMW